MPQVDQFWEQCDPTKENLCLYGYADSTWEVTLPCEEVPPELPEPTLGINFARDGGFSRHASACFWPSNALKTERTVKASCPRVPGPGVSW